MIPPSDMVRRSRFLAKTVLVGAAALLLLLIAIPFVVPHESLPEPLVVFISIFILIAALIAGTAAAYVFMSRAQGGEATPPPPLATDASGGPDLSSRELGNLVVRLLDGDERRVMRILMEAKGEMPQQDLVRITAFSEAKVSRLLDRLEKRGLVIRERHGMTNRVRLTLREG